MKNNSHYDQVFTQAVYKLADTISINTIHQQMKGINEQSLIGFLKQVGNNEHLIESIKDKGLPKSVICSEDKHLLCILLFNFCEIKVHSALPHETILLSWVDGEVKFPNIRLYECLPPSGVLIVRGQTT